MLFTHKENDIVSPTPIVEDENIILEVPVVNETEQYNNVKILIDNGHGINTGGKRSPYSLYRIGEPIEFYEYQWNREIASLIVNDLKNKGFNAHAKSHAPQSVVFIQLVKLGIFPFAVNTKLAKSLIHLLRLAQKSAKLHQLLF